MPELQSSEKFYRLLLHLYPHDFRQEWGDEMLRLFQDQRRDSAQPVGFWLHILTDLLESAVKEHLNRMKISPSTFLVFLLALASAVFAGYIDLTASETQSVVGVVLVGTFLLGVLKPRGLPFWALLFALGVVGAELFGLLTGFEPLGYAHSRAVNPVGTAGPSYGALPLLFLVISLIGAVGAGGGAGARWLINLMRKPGTTSL